MRTIRITTYNRNPKHKDKDRKPKIELYFPVYQIMALTTARGQGKWPKLYVADYNEPLELPEQTFEEVKDKLIEASLSEYHDINKFLPVGQKVLVNYDTVFRVRKTSGEIVFIDNQILGDLEVESLSEYEKLSVIEKNKPREPNWEGAQLFIEKVAKWQEEQTYKRSNKFTRMFTTVSDKSVAIGFLVFVNIILSLILIVMIGILLYRL